KILEAEVTEEVVSFLKQKNERFYVMDENPTAESIAKLIYDYVRSKHLPVTRVTLWETESSFATYRGK
ncbi:MAG: 6-carboxytetrahydropterin synthase, partial [Candidatus Omnitrophica bacterium]|nr:6-carboxytetrahydropterin synthase [Candidatus Omnitrophota bacterium]